MLVDGMALLFRGFFSTSFRGNFMYTKDNVPTNGVHQFLRYFLHAVHTYEPTHVVCLWDMGSKTFRTELFDQYKGDRPPPPEELVPQFHIVREVVDAFDIPNIGIENYEADDCIGTIAKQYKHDYEVTVLSGDHDLLQLVDDHVQVAIMKKGIGNYELYTKENFYEKVGLHAEQIIDFKGLMGDSSDNYPGVKGIGEKTALKLMREYETVENLLECIDDLPNGTRNRLTEHKDMLFLSQKLAEIDCAVPLECDLSNALWDIDLHKVMEMGNVYELTRVLERELRHVQPKY